MIAEYERAQIIERTRRGKTHRARQGTVNVLSGAPFGYRYVRRSEHADARYEVVAHEAAIVAELFRRYVEDGVAIAELARWLTATEVPHPHRQVPLGPLGDLGHAAQPRLRRTRLLRQDHPHPGSARPQPHRPPAWPARATPRSYSVTDRPREDWLQIPVPALVTEDTWTRAQQRLADNKRYAARNTKIPSLLQGLAVCASCGYAYYRGHTTTTAGNKIYYYRCLGSDNYRYEHGRVCDNKPVRTDYLDGLVWEPHHRPARRPGADPRRDRPAPGSAAHRRPHHRRAAAPRAGPGQDHRRHHPADQGLPGRADLPRRAARAHPRAALPPDQPAQPARRPGRPARRPPSLPQARHRPRGLPRPPPRQRRHRDRPRTAARPAPARQGRPHRPRTHPHPPLHPHHEQRNHLQHDDRRR